MMSATDMVRPDRLDIDPEVWTPAHLALIRAVAREPEVARIFVNAATKKALCREAGSDRGWMTKVRPMFGHNYHFHIRLACPHGEVSCAGPGSDPPTGDGCGAELDRWFTDEMRSPKPGKPRPPMTLAQAPPRVSADPTRRVERALTATGGLRRSLDPMLITARIGHGGGGRKGRGLGNRRSRLQEGRQLLRARPKA